MLCGVMSSWKTYYVVGVELFALIVRTRGHYGERNRSHAGSVILIGGGFIASESAVNLI